MQSISRRRINSAYMYPTQATKRLEWVTLPQRDIVIELLTVLPR
jgi:hypothetical protein